MEKKHSFIDELKENFHKDALRTLYFNVEESKITEEKAAENIRLLEEK